MTDEEWIVRFVLARLAIVKIRQKTELHALNDEIKELRQICDNIATDQQPLIMDMAKQVNSLEHQERILWVINCTPFLFELLCLICMTFRGS